VHRAAPIADTPDNVTCPCYVPLRLHPSEINTKKALSLLLSFTVFFGGAVVMLVELCGARALAPAFGAGLFVWAAILAVTLGALAVGYYTGGAWADRRPAPRTLGIALVSAAGALTLAVPIAPALLQWGMQQDPRIGSLVTASVLFGPSLIALGMVSPIAVRLAMTDVRLAGHQVGRMYAISTAGSLLGTLFVAFILIPNAETDIILFGAAAGLAMVGALWLAGGARIAALVLVFAPAFLSDAQPRVLPAGLQTMGRVQSPYGLLEVIDDSARRVRFMRADHSIIGARAADGTGAFAYTHVLEVLRFARPAATSLLQIGLGTGTFPLAMERRGLEVDVVEIDPDVVELARAFFDYTGDVVIEDARTFINRSSDKYDFVVHDTFTGGVTPAHLLSWEVLVRARALLKPGGILVVNLPGFSEGPHAVASHALARTMREVFTNVRAFRDSAHKPGAPSLSNLLFFASDQPLELRIPQDAHFESAACQRALSRFTSWEVLTDQAPAPRVTDARNPLTSMQMPIAEAHYQAMNKLLPPQAWLPW
jgi:spermidine synthase